MSIDRSYTLKLPPSFPQKSMAACLQRVKIWGWDVTGCTTQPSEERINQRSRPNKITVGVCLFVRDKLPGSCWCRELSKLFKILFLKQHTFLAMGIVFLLAHI